ncbi:hypothetical protein RD1_0380 [Roseobacter denitrificans OCh 114]|uniref:Uncharacterized protein n=1 Tax=Roseobacter denitrificans (strain ATCC 33942 / OCh 114) TaxID=375451 RepID=Q16D43_ROSDO|nr:hypothetical protein RD1_0380 [Roseobacter denitrificans OCh 114]
MTKYLKHQVSGNAGLLSSALKNRCAALMAAA